MSQYKDKELLRKIARKLKKLREERGVSQQEVYNETEIHIARIETAQTNVTVSTLSQLCKYFKISLSAFFEEMGSD